MSIAETSARPTDVAEVRTVLEAVASGLRGRDAAAVARHFAPGARIFDLAPPLMRSGADGAELQKWIDGWDGPVDTRTRDLEVEVDGDLAVAHGLEQTNVARDGEDIAWWARVTTVLRRTSEGWRITHAHSSVPFHMDGSYRAAIDLEP